MCSQNLTIMIYVYDIVLAKYSSTLNLKTFFPRIGENTSFKTFSYKKGINIFFGKTGRPGLKKSTRPLVMLQDK